ncbi:MAG: ABC transporter transmembrane domain-containing protein [Desulforhabdus sp.]|jgi:subfamily B ATP-binding cassette protein MsbA|nr:ABC transporter transmembrane domain-containing protein [Desulforhabdus sp.]
MAVIGSNEKFALKQLVALLNTHYRRLALAVLCMLGAAGATAATAYLIKPAMDEIFINKNLAMLQMIPVVFLAVALINALCQWGNDYYLKSVGLSIVAHLRQQLYNHIQDMPLSFFDKSSTGLLMSRITNDVNEIQNAVTRGFTGLIRDSFSVVGLIFVVFYQDWKLASIAVFILPLAFYPLFKFGSKLRRLATKGQETMADLNIILHETFSGTRIVKAFGMEEYEKQRFSDRNQRVLKYYLKSEWIDALSSPLMELIGALAIALVIGYGGYQVIQGASTPGTFFSFLGGLLMLYRPVKSLSKANTVVQKGIASTIRVYAILGEQNTLLEKIDAVDLAPIRQQIKFRSVSFAYNDKMVLQDINLVVPAGQVVALAGSSGGGKTTLVNLIPRFYDVTQGAILIDGTDIRDLTLRSLREQIAIVTQQSFLFNDAVRNNIAYGNLNKTDKDIVLAAQSAYAKEFIEQLPHGFDTTIGEQGVMLSGGQRQRICIARAVLKDAPILILDEATSSLDSESELEVQMALENLMQGRTTFVIAHRLSTIQKADRILVIASGRIVEEGTHSELLSRDGEYRRLFDIQFMKPSI